MERSLGYFALALCALFVVADAAFVDTLYKCRINDGECERKLYQYVLKSISKTGVPDLGIPVLDPIHLENVSVSILGLTNITLLDGVAKGVKDCQIVKFKTNMENEFATMEMMCDLTIKGRYKVSSNSPLVKELLGGSSVRGEGNGKVRLEKLLLKFDFEFYAQRREDNEIILKCKNQVMKYTYDILGKTTFAADNLYLGDTEVSGMVVNLLNENWKFIMTSFGKPFVDKAMEFVYLYSHKFFDVVPVKYYIIDDLSPYARP